MKNRWIYIWMSILFLAMVLLYPREGKFEYEYQKGSPWVYPTLITSFDFPILKTEQELFDEMEKRSGDETAYYNFESSVASKKISQFANSSLSAGIPPSLVDRLSKRLDKAYAGGIIADSEDENPEDRTIVVKKNKKMEEFPLREIPTVSDVYDEICEVIRGFYPTVSGDSIINLLNVRGAIAPNLLYDDYATKIAHREYVNSISPTKGMVYSGQLIVSSGELITPETFQVLESYKAEYINNFGFSGSRFALWMSHVLMSLILVVILFLCISFAERDIMVDSRKIVFILLQEFIIFFVTVQIYIHNRDLLLLMPFAVTAMFVNAFFKKSTTAILFPALLLPVLVVPERGLELYMVNLTGGMLILFTRRFFYRGWQIFINAGVAFVGMSAVLFSFGLSAGLGVSQMIKSHYLMTMAINAIGSVILYQFVYLFEKLFGFVSYSKLRDLADTNNVLLQHLQKSAPGTFQHSLQVANIAENAARQIGANDLLVRVGALYHDVGKLGSPMSFIENAAVGIDNHSGLSPKESAAIIIRHVDEGMELAASYSLPSLVSDFILTHHGRTLVSYFYNEHCNRGGDPNEIDSFTYHGMIPQTKEQSILMLADAIEAASRTLKDYSEKSISKLVDDIFVAKHREGQFVQADISYKELNIVVESFKTYLQHIYHQRIAYPSRKERPQRKV